MLVAPEPDRQQPHVDDEVYVVLEGRGVLEVEGESVEVSEGKAAFVPAGADHRFTGLRGPERPRRLFPSASTGEQRLELARDELRRRERRAAYESLTEPRSTELDLAVRWARSSRYLDQRLTSIDICQTILYILPTRLVSEEEIR